MASISEMKVEIVGKETIKPSSPTPPHLKTSSLCVFDQFTPEMYVPLLLFYPATSDQTNTNHRSLFSERSNHLKESLSLVLCQFYRFAGEFEYNVSISCNDHGVGFLEAEVNYPISKILASPDYELLKQFIPAAMESKQAEAGHLLLVQTNLFSCGGMAIGVSVSHKVADAFTLSTFIKKWAQISLGKATADDIVLPEVFCVASELFPPHDFFNSPQPAIEFAVDNCVTKRFVFDGSKIADLKSRVSSATVPNPTRVEAVSALIWKCATQASRSNLGFIKPSVFLQVVNMRKKSGEDMTDKILGNFMWYFASMTMESELDLQNMVEKLRTGLEEHRENYPNGVSSEIVFQSIKESGNLMVKESIENFSCSSWCRFPFYEADFGWGKPSWVSIRSSEYKNTLFLMDSSSDGVEALLTFKLEDMALFENNEELLAYASLNPPAI